MCSSDLMLDIDDLNILRKISMTTMHPIYGFATYGFFHPNLCLTNHSKVRIKHSCSIVLMTCTPVTREGGDIGLFITLVPKVL